MQTLQAVQVKQMQQPQANQPTQAPTQGNPVLMQNTQQQMMPPQGNVRFFSVLDQRLICSWTSIRLILTT